MINKKINKYLKIKNEINFLDSFLIGNSISQNIIKYLNSDFNSIKKIIFLTFFIQTPKLIKFNDSKKLILILHQNRDDLNQQTKNIHKEIKINPELENILIKNDSNFYNTKFSIKFYPLKKFLKIIEIFKKNEISMNFFQKIDLYVELSNLKKLERYYSNLLKNKEFTELYGTMSHDKNEIIISSILKKKNPALKHYSIQHGLNLIMYPNNIISTNIQILNINCDHMYTFGKYYSDLFKKYSPNTTFQEVTIYSNNNIHSYKIKEKILYVWLDGPDTRYLNTEILKNIINFSEKNKIKYYFRKHPNDKNNYDEYKKKHYIDENKINHNHTKINIVHNSSQYFKFFLDNQICFRIFLNEFDLNLNDIHFDIIKNYKDMEKIIKIDSSYFKKKKEVKKELFG